MQPLGIFYLRDSVSCHFQSVYFFRSLFVNLPKMTHHTDTAGYNTQLPPYTRAAEYRCYSVQYTTEYTAQYNTEYKTGYASQYQSPAGLQHRSSVSEGLCHDPYTLPPSADQTWEEVWESISDRRSSVDIVSNSNSNGRSTSQSDDDSLGDDTTTDMATVSTESAAASELVGKFPVAPHGRCAHRQWWERLRGKRGHSYFVCLVCGIGWRQQTKVQTKKYAHCPMSKAPVRKHQGA